MMARWNIRSNPSGPKSLKDYRKRAQLIFQDPYAALSPRMTVRDIIAEPLEVMGLTNSREETDAARARNRGQMPVEP